MENIGMSSTPTRNVAMIPVLGGCIWEKVAPEHNPNAREVVRASLRFSMERDRAVPRPHASAKDKPTR
jgi:hypothetical protein